MSVISVEYKELVDSHISIDMSDGRQLQIYADETQDGFVISGSLRGLVVRPRACNMIHVDVEKK